MYAATHLGFMAEQDRIVDYCHGLGIRHVIADGHQLPVTEAGALHPAPVHELKRKLETAGLELVNVGIGFVGAETLADDTEAEAKRRALLDNVRLVGDAGIDLAHVFTMVSRGEGDDAAGADNWKRLIGYYRELGDVCERAGVRLATHGSYTWEHYLDRPQSFRDLFAAVPSDHLGACVCIGCFRECGSDPAAAITALGDKVWFVHFRDCVINAEDRWENCHIGEGDLDFKEIRQALREVDFQGPVMPEHLRKVAGEPGNEVSAARALGYVQRWIQESRQ
jgi:sugar phosphate isomerase/epimerase